MGEASGLVEFGNGRSVPSPVTVNPEMLFLATEPCRT